jgi:hypothetical protein
MIQMAMMMGGGRGGGFGVVEPSSILWIDENPTTTAVATANDIQKMSVDELKDRAVEITSLQGMSRDDIREMLLALLPPKNAA